MNGRPRRNIRDLLFGGDEEPIEERDIDEAEQLREATPTDTTIEWARQSLYIEVLERAIMNIKKTERELSLFSDEEWHFLDTIADLDYPARFVLMRLIMRKPGQWYRISSLQKYVIEVGEEGLLQALLGLCKPFATLADPMDVDEEDDGIIDLTLDSDDEEDVRAPTQPVAGPSNPCQDGPNLIQDPPVRLDYFCQGESDMSLLEGLRSLNVDEIKKICKVMKVKHVKLVKDEMVMALVNHAATQSTLPFELSPKSKGKGKAKHQDTLRQTTLCFPVAKSQRGSQETQTSRLRQMMLEHLGKSVKVNPYIHRLMVRLHIIYLRSTEFPTSLFQDALLAGFKKRTFAEYEHVRDPDIWCTREQYLKYETALRVEATIDAILEPDAKAERGKTQARADPGRQFIAAGTLGLEFMRSLTTPVRTPAAAEGDEEPLEFDVVEDSSNEEKARTVKRIFEEHALPKWRELVAADSEAVRKPGLERFEPGFVYTRIVRKGAHALATLKEFAFEKEVIDALLEQRRWRRGRRGAWYERRAILQTRHLFKDSEGKTDVRVLQQARNGLIEALADDDTHAVMRPSLIRRLAALEKRLKMPAEQRSQYDDQLLKAPDVVRVNAIRVWEHPDAINLDANGTVKGKENKTANTPSVTNYFATVSDRLDGSPDARRANTETKKGSGKWRWKGKSLWKGKDGSSINVETRALEYYETLGFKGFHSETQILTTLFGLLFWDIIFANVPGAFETPWQTGPLDIAEDSFYYARQDLIEKRLEDINSGQARAILERHDEKYREKKTCCIGVSWQVCDRDALVEIVECLGGEALSSICRLFCEDYGGRRSGVPDLIVWNPDTNECKFVEVKGPGDSLQENQKLWSDSLMNARCAVEVCRIVDPKKEAKEEKERTEKQEKKEREKEERAEKKAAAKVEKAATKTPRPRGRSARASTSKRKGEGEAETSPAASGDEPESGDGIDIPIIVPTDDDEAWMPSTEIREALPSYGMKRRGRTEDDDEMPLFGFPPPPESISTRHPLAIARKWPNHRAEVFLESPSKKRKTI
ncbi:VRR-NUC domain-containing protein [Mycena sp. CBHHK59/15]|nr:VRR-NUC domain-containing protein [Mycena sp. CBHHK59/15]